MASTCDSDDFTGTLVSVPNLLSSVLNVRANRFPHSGCLGASERTTVARRASNGVRLAADVRVPRIRIPLLPEGNRILRGRL